jgi:hypothetical protein
MSLETSAFLSKRASLLMVLVNTEFKPKVFDAVVNVDNIKDVAEPYKTWLKDFSKIPDNAKWLTPEQEMQKDNPPFSQEIMDVLKTRKANKEK